MKVDDIETCFQDIESSYIIVDDTNMNFVDVLLHLRKEYQLKALIHNNVNLEFNFLFKKLLLDNYIYCEIFYHMMQFWKLV